MTAILRRHVPSFPLEMPEAGTRAGRLVIVSNRVAAPEAKLAGGLGQALRSFVTQRGGIWVGWSGRCIRDGERIHSEHVGRAQYLTLDLPAAEFDPFYKEYANGALWPILHGRPDLVAPHLGARDAYWAVNRRFAGVLLDTLASSDTVWVQDYHLIPLGQLLRERGARCRIGFFLHTPMASADTLVQLPHHRELLGALAAYDLVGVQTDTDRAALVDAFARIGGRTEADGRIGVGARRTSIRAFPIGVDADALARLGQAALRRPRVQALRNDLRDRALLIGVDRLDYSKGIPERIAAFDRLLEREPELRHRLTYLQIAPESRSDVPEYRRLGRSVQRAVGRVNGRHGDETWTPMRYVNRTYALEDLAGYYRLARVGLVTPLRDGMNLVAKEFVACQDPRDPGVLVLSKFAGAASELRSALIVDPNDTAGCTDAIARALRMPLSERLERWRADLAVLRAHSIHDWGEEFLAALEGCRGLADPILAQRAHGRGMDDRHASAGSASRQNARKLAAVAASGSCV
jgi:trehalose 6-phosphate synthase